MSLFQPPPEITINDFTCRWRAYKHFEGIIKVPWNAESKKLWNRMLNGSDTPELRVKTGEIVAILKNFMVIGFEAGEYGADITYFATAVYFD